MGHEMQRRAPGGAVRQAGGMGDLNAVIAKRVGEIGLAFNKDTDRFRQTLIHMLNAAITRNPELQKCDPDSFISAACQAGTLGLDLNPHLGEAYLVPQWNKHLNGLECCLRPGYVGLVKLVRKSRQVKSIRAAIVYEDDEFDYEWSPHLRLRHRPALAQRGVLANGKGVKAVYAFVELANGEQLVEVMTVADVESVRQRSKSPNSGPWANDWGEMAKKTALRRIIKMLPKSDDGDDLLARALEANDGDFEHDASPEPDNQSGFGRGQYASPEQTKEYRDEIERFLSRQNDEWRNRWTDPDTGEIPTAAKDLATVWELDKHLVGFCVDTGRLDASIDVDKLLPRHVGRYTAIAWHRSVKDRNAMKLEAKAYLDTVRAQQSELIEKEMGDSPEEEPEVDLDFDGLEDLKLDAPPEPTETVPPAPKPEALKGKNGKKQQASLIENDPDVWPEGKE